MIGRSPVRPWRLWCNGSTRGCGPPSGSSNLPSRPALCIYTVHGAIDTTSRVTAVRDINEQQFHWLVGILEGEGTFIRASSSSPGLPGVRVSMTDRDVIERVAALLGRATQTLRARKPHHKRPYATTIKGAPAVQLMKAVRPFLGNDRQAHIDRSIASWHGGPARWRRPSARCAVPACLRPGSVRGLCRRHYDRWWKATRKGRFALFVPREAPSQSSDGQPESSRHPAFDHIYPRTRNGARSMSPRSAVLALPSGCANFGR